MPICRVCVFFRGCVSSRTSAKDVQYESTFLTVMTLRRLLWMPSRNNVTWKLIGLSNDSSKGNVGPVRCRLRFERNLLLVMARARGSGFYAENNGLYIFWGEGWKDKKKKKKKLAELEKKSGASRDRIHEAVHYPDINHVKTRRWPCEDSGIYLTRVNTFARSKPSYMIIFNEYLSP